MILHNQIIHRLHQKTSRMSSHQIIEATGCAPGP